MKLYHGTDNPNFKLQPIKPERFRGVFSSLSQELLHPEGTRFEKPTEEPAQIPKTPTQKPSSQAKVGRNDPCPCGSEKKYKKCHGK